MTTVPVASSPPPYRPGEVIYQRSRWYVQYAHATDATRPKPFQVVLDAGHGQRNRHPVLLHEFKTVVSARQMVRRLADEHAAQIARDAAPETVMAEPAPQPCFECGTTEQVQLQSVALSVGTVVVEYVDVVGVCPAHMEHMQASYPPSTIFTTTRQQQRWYRQRNQLRQRAAEQAWRMVAARAAWRNER